MRIVGGKWAGRDLASPGGRVRPTAESVRVLCLELVEPRLRGARVLDLFAGSGALGLEALSRGADRCDFVENHASALHALKANVAALKVKARSRIFKKDAIPLVERLDSDAYDIAFADPPYGSRKLDRVLSRWLEVPFSRVLVLEHAADHDLSPAMSRANRSDAVTRARPDCSTSKRPRSRIRTSSRRIDNTMVTILSL